MLLRLLLFIHTKKNLNNIFCSRFGYGYCFVHSSVYGYGLCFITFINWIMSVPWLELGSTGKYQHLVSGVPSTSCWYFPVLPSSCLGTNSVQCSRVQYSAVQWSRIPNSAQWQQSYKTAVHWSRVSLTNWHCLAMTRDNTSHCKLHCKVQCELCCAVNTL